MSLTLWLQAAARLGVELSSALRVILVAPARDYTSSNGSHVSGSDVELLARITAGHRIHHAFTGTGSLNLAAVAAVPGSVPARLRPKGVTGKLRFGHPGGVMDVQADVEMSSDSSIGGWQATGAGFFRSARCLMSGEVHLS